MINKIIRKIFYRLSHNVLAHNISIVFGFEKKLKFIDGYWNTFQPDPSKSLQENVGFSHKPDVEEALKKTHKDLIVAADSCLSPGQSILDIGCGTGLYLKEFNSNKYKLHGIDLSAGMIQAAKGHLPGVQFYVGDFMEQVFDRKFNFIYSVSVLEYISRTDLSPFFRKLNGMLEINGVIFIHYPQAISFYDLLYPDLNYIKYSPAVVEKTASEYFMVISHAHGFDGRVIKRYDPSPYPSTAATFKNGYLLIARKK